MHAVCQSKLRSYLKFKDEEIWWYLLMAKSTGKGFDLGRSLSRTIDAFNLHNYQLQCWPPGLSLPQWVAIPPKSPPEAQDPIVVQRVFHKSLICRTRKVYAPNQWEISLMNWQKLKSVILSRIGENVENVDTVYTAGQRFHAMAHSAASVRIENACKGLICGILLNNKGNELLI